MSQVVPAECHRFFWDTDPTKLSIPGHSFYIIERLLEYGDLAAFGWLRATYSLEDIKQVVRESGRLSRRSANFWAYVLDLDPETVRCLSTSFRKTQRVLWNR